MFEKGLKDLSEVLCGTSKYEKILTFQMESVKKSFIQEIDRKCIPWDASLNLFFSGLGWRKWNEQGKKTLFL